jgi:AraC-like DNA-binding protein
VRRVTGEEQALLSRVFTRVVGRSPRAFRQQLALR